MYMYRYIFNFISLYNLLTHQIYLYISAIHIQDANMHSHLYFLLLLLQTSPLILYNTAVSCYHYLSIVYLLPVTISTVNSIIIVICIHGQNVYIYIYIYIYIYNY